MKRNAFPLARKAIKFTPLFAVLATTFPALAQAQGKGAEALEPVVVTATRNAQSISDTLSDTSIITSDEIERSGHITLVDLLQARRGVEITRNGGPGSSSSVFIRGADNKQNVVLIDGVRIGSSTSGGANWAAMPLSQIDRIEIVHGPLSSLYGADAVGGVIQIFTKKGEGAPRVNASVGIGSDETRTVDAGIAGAALENGRLTYALNVAREKAEGFSVKKPGVSGYNPDKDGYERESVSGQLGYELAKGHALNLSFLNSENETQYDSSALRDDRSYQKLESYAITSTNQLAQGWVSRLQAGRSKDKSIDVSGSVSRYYTVQDYLSWQNDIVLRNTDLFQFVLERREEKVDSTESAVNRERTTNSVAAAYQLREGDHLASVSLRNDDNSQFGSHTTGSIGYGYKLTNALRANASYGTSFRAPTFNELYVPNYGVPSNRPEEGKNLEAGLFYKEGATQLSAVYYRNRLTNLLLNADPCPLPGYTWGCAYNVNEATLEGWSLSAETRTGNFIWRGTLDLQDPRDETTQKRLQRRAKKYGTVAAEYVGNASNVGAEVVFSSDRFDNAANTNLLPGYGLVNLFGSYQLNSNWSLFGRWDNVFDKDYETARGYATAGSTVFVGVRYGR